MPIDWDTLKRNPKYKQLTYENQLLVNSKVALNELQKNPKFQQLTPQNKQAVLKQVSTQKPVYENPDSEVMKIEQLAEASKENPEVADQAIDKIGWRAFREQLTIIDMIEGVAGRTIGMLNPNSFDYQRIKQENQLETRDREKAYQYLEQSINENLDKAKAISRHKTLGTIGGFVTDFAAWWGATAPAASMLKAGVKASTLGQKTGMFATKFAGEGSAITSGGKRWFYQTLVPEVAQNTRGGLIGVARENINGLIEEKTGEDPEWYDAAWENTKTFGEYFLGDMLFFSGLQAARVIGKAGKGVYTHKWSKRLSKEMVGDDEFENVMRQMVQRGGLDVDSIPNISNAEKDELRRVAMDVARAKNVPNLKNNPQELTRYWLRGKKFDVFQDGNKWKSKYIPDNTVLEADNFQEIVQKSLNHGDVKMKPQFDTPAEAAAFMGGSNEMQIQQVLRANTSGLNIDEYGMAQILKPDSAGFVNKNNVNYVGNEIMKKTGLNQNQIKQVKYRQVDDYFDRVNTKENDVIFVPKRISEPAQEQQFIKKLTKDVKETVEAKGGSFQNYQDIGERILRTKEQMGFSPHWIQYAAKKYTDGDIVRVGEKLQLRTRNGIEVEGNMKEIGEHIFKRYAFADPDADMLTHTKNYLFAEKGMRLSEKKGKLRLEFRDNQGRMVRRDYNNLQELWNDNPNTIPNLPTSSLPDINITDTKLTRFEIRQGIAAGPPKMMVDFMSDFKDYKTLNNFVPLKTSKGNIVAFNRKYRKYRVTDNDTGVTKDFRKLDDAKRFVDDGVKTFKQLDERARYKGARITPYKGDYLIYQNGIDTPLIAKNMDEAKAKIRDLKQADYMGKELTDLDQATIDDIQTQFREHMPEQGFEEEFHKVADRIINHARKTGGKVTGKTVFVDRVAPKDMTMTRVAKELGDPAIYDNYRAVEKGRQRAEGSFAAWLKDFRRMTGKITSKQDDGLGAVMLSGAPESEWGRLFKDAAGREMTQKDLKIIDRVRTMLGRSPEEGLFNVFGVDNYKYITEYFPRIRKAIEAKGGVNFSSPNAGKVIKQELGYTDLPKEIKFFADNMRTDDMLRFHAKSSLTDVLATYARAGYNKIHMDGPYRKAVKYFDDLKQNGGDKKAVNIMQAYLEQIKGIESTAEKRLLEEGTKDLTYKIFKQMDKIMGTNRADRLFTDDLITLGNKFTIASTMSFRAWLPIRNSFQPFFTLAPRVGNDVVMEGMKRAAKNGEEIVNRLKRQGRIPDRAPIMDFIGGNDKMLIDAFNNKGMFWYQNSDAWTRGVADQTADLLMSDAAMRFSKGMINEKQFLDLSKIDILDDLKQKEILDHLRSGNYAQAKDNFADHLTTETFFPYKAGTNPSMFTGTMGRIFGGFGHYPVYFTANVARGLRQSKGWGKRAAFAGRLVGNSFAIYNVFNEVLGIDAKAFMFNSPMSFEGGPYYSLLNTALAATNTSYYTGDIARAKLGQEMGRLFLPGSSLYRSGMKALEELDKGNTHGFIVNALSAPLNENF